MKTALFTFLLAMSALGQTSNRNLKIELRSQSQQVHLLDTLVLSVIFRSPEGDITLWNAMGWGSAAGLSLMIEDQAGHKINTDLISLYNPLPPDPTGRASLLSVHGHIFAGFESQIPVKMLFSRPGKYRLKCSYLVPLPRGYFKETTIWGREDGRIQSAEISITVEK
jgi:hypothetical protein